MTIPVYNQWISGVGTVLEFVDVHKNYKEEKALKGVSFQLEQGEVLGLIGSNGAGKSTTLSLIATLIRPDLGSIHYMGQDIVKHPEYMRKHLGYVPQDIALYQTLSGFDNLKFWGKANGVKTSLLKERIHLVQKMTYLSDDILKKKVNTYSGGMKRRLNIAVALLHLPKLVIMDEPTVGLDVESRNYILQTVKDLKSNHVSVIYTSHYMEEIEEIADRICILHRGEVELQDHARELLLNYKDLEQLYLERQKNRKG